MGNRMSLFAERQFPRSMQLLSGLTASPLALIVGLLALVQLAVVAPTRADDSTERSISVSGKAETRVAPDMAQLQLEIVREDLDAAAARREADAVTGKALDIIAAAGIEDADRDSSGLRVAPQYRWNKSTQKQELTGYRVSRSIEVRLLDLSALGTLLTELSDAGVNRIDEPRMGLQDDESVYQQLLSEASRNARDRAQAIASTLGEELGQVLHVSTHEVAVPRPMVMERAMMAADASTSAASESYQTGHISYRVTVSASFALR